jgi:hypothetical protein
MVTTLVKSTSHGHTIKPRVIFKQGTNWFGI